jgi:hypothetical protein
MLRALHEGLDRSGMPKPQQEMFLGALVDCHSLAVKSGLRGMAALPEMPPPLLSDEMQIEREVLPAAGVQLEEIRLRPQGGGMVRNVFTRTGIWTNLQRGTWVEFKRDENVAVRSRLTWISPNKGVYLFTNPFEANTAISISPEALAEEMRLGGARVIDDAPLVERAVDSMLTNLREAQG